MAVVDFIQQMDIYKNYPPIYAMMIVFTDTDGYHRAVASEVLELYEDGEGHRAVRVNNVDHNLSVEEYIDVINQLQSFGLLKTDQFGFPASTRRKRRG